MPEGGLTLKVEGLEELLERIQEEKFLGPHIRRFFERAGKTVENRAKTYTPVDTGRLRASVTTAVDAATVPLWGTVGTNVFYAPYLEFGENKHPRRTGRIPFMRPALADSRPEIDAIVEKTAREIKEAWGK